mgnify:CR=1 FL=1
MTVKSKTYDMKKLYLLLIVTYFFAPLTTNAQCTTHTLDWDFREFFAQDNVDIRTYVTLAQSQTQHFAFGANKLTITHDYTNSSNINGDVLSHTGETGSYGTGADVQFKGNGKVEFNFQNAVTDLKFSLYDIDRSQRVDVDAYNGATAVPVTLSKVGSSGLTITNNNSVNAYATGISNSVANNSTEGTVNVDVTASITRVVITVTATGTCSSNCSGTGGNEDGSFFISDITACSDGSFPNNYYAISRPFDNQPSYMLLVVNNKFYYIDAVTGRAVFIFQDNTHTNMNSLAYDPINRLIYYTYSLSSSGGGVNSNEKALRRYDMNMDTFGVVLNNVNNLGIPTFGQGVESGAAGFYNGNLYWGIEGHSNINIESIIYKIDLNSNQFPVGFSQVYAQNVRTGSNRLHDWADFAINDGILIDYDGGVANQPLGVNTNFYHQNLLTGAVTTYVPPSGVIPAQVCVDWQGNTYNVTGSGTIAGNIIRYNGTNNWTGSAVVLNENGANLYGSFAAEAFRPYCDFGDAPASYDPDQWSPAVHERDTSLRIGTNLDIEWLKRGATIDADSDNYDDGIATVTLFSNLYSTYQVLVDVWNNTGQDATLIGWLDWNGNGVFDAGEASAVQTISSQANMQSVYLSWTGISSPLQTGDLTHLRIRLTSASNNMTAADPTGFFLNGEVEDYPVLVENIVLPLTMVSFDAKTINQQSVLLNWKAVNDLEFSGFEIQRSSNNNTWTTIGFVPAVNSPAVHAYQFNDVNALKGNSQYRLHIIHKNGNNRFSEVRSVNIKDSGLSVIISPNPASSRVSIQLSGTKFGEMAQVRIMDAGGKEVHSEKLALRAGSTSLEIPVSGVWHTGNYLVIVTTDNHTKTEKLIIKR